MASSRFRLPGNRALHGCLLALFLLTCSRRTPPELPYSDARSRLVETLVVLPQETGRVVGGFLPAGAPGTKPASREERDQAIARVRDRDLKTAPGDVPIAGLWQREVSDVLSELVSETELYPDSADLWSDLAAVYLLRYSREPEKDPLDLWRAVQAADLALSLEPQHREARFNLARALDDLHLDAVASEEWSRVLREGLPPAWHRIAEDRLEDVNQQLENGKSVQTALLELRQALREGRPPRREDVDRAFPFLRSELEDALAPILLGGLEKSASSGLDSDLEPFRMLAQRIRVASTDSFAAECLESVPEALRRSTPRERELWKQALEDLWKGIEALESRRYEAAEERLGAAFQRLDAFGSPLRWSAAVRLEDAIQYQRKEPRQLDRVAARLADLRLALAPQPFPGLLARATWIQARVVGNAGRMSEAMELKEDAAGAFARLGEPQSEAALLALRSQGLLLLGRPQDAWREVAEVFDRVRLSWTLRPLHNGVAAAMAVAHNSGWGLLTNRLREIDSIEGHARESALGPQQALAETMAEILILQAEGLVEALQTEEEDPASARTGSSTLDQAQRAAGLLKDASPWLERLDPASEVRQKLQCDVAGAWAVLLMIDPKLGPAPIPGGLLSPADCLRVASNLLRPYERELDALKARREGRRLEAVELLTEAVTEILRQSEKPPEVGRSTFLASHRRRLDRLVDWRLKDGPPAPALGWLLAAFKAEASGNGKRAGGAAEAGRLRLDPEEGEGILVLHALPHRVAGWLVQRGLREPFHFSWTVERSALPALEAKLRSELLLEQGAASQTLQDFSSHLLTPVAKHLNGLRSLIILPSPELRSLPFAALLKDPNSPQPAYLIKDLEVSIVLPAEARTGRRPQAGLSRDSLALFVGNPRSSDSRKDALSDLPELPGAEQEAKALVTNFPRALPPLVGSDATLDSVRRSLPNVALAHLAAHATWTSRGSALVLAAPPAQPGQASGSQLLGAAELSLLDLSHAEVIVLAACRSARPGSPAANAQGLIEPLLRAGARTVVASPWPVADSLSPEFWRAFYEELLKGKSSAAAALRQAQETSLGSNNPNLANPAFWAGFAIYHGDLPLKGE